MTAVGVHFGRRAPAPTREELRRQLLALVLALVLVWYTFVVPANAAARSYNGATPDDEGLDGEVRGVGGAGRAEKLEREKAATEAADELDWPEYIYP
jgi:hypothetical protein